MALLRGCGGTHSRGLRLIGTLLTAPNALMSTVQCRDALCRAEAQKHCVSVCLVVCTVCHRTSGAGAGATLIGTHAPEHLGTSIALPFHLRRPGVGDGNSCASCL